ncbi:MAG: DNA translocase FtsK 4TM domain-containing protein [Hyphomicrobiales bacterium]|nr:DNA translocase FtsK 4TM domain-containing protein [Hyphomicrobiales bacterium]
MIIAGLALALAMATWSIQDPSLNHAAARAQQNLLGYPGAVAADLAMQIFGLGAVILIFLLWRWGWLALTQSPFPRRRRRVLAAIGALIAASACAATWPVPVTWPLPSGLGGFLGDRVLALALSALALPANLLTHALGGLIFAAATLAGLAYAAQMSLARLLVDRGGEDFDTEDEDAAAPMSLIGALEHLVLAARARTKRLIRYARDWRRLRDRLLGRTDPDAGDFHVLPDGRIEPHFAGLRAPGAAPSDDAQATAAKCYNVEARAPAPRPGQRAAREAQPSLFAGSTYRLPHLQLLTAAKSAARKTTVSTQALEQNARLLEGVLDDFGVKGEIINVRPGPVVTLYELEPAPGIKSARVIGLADDIARSMSAIACRVAVVPGRNVIGIELPNSEREIVFLREILASQDYERSKARLPLALGKTIGGEPVIADLARMPHLLIAGTTGSGKSVGINTMILSLIYRLPPEQCRMIMVDPKMLELSVYDGIPHLLAPVVTDPKKAVVALKWTVREMEERYMKMSKLGVRNIDGFNQRVGQALEAGETISRTVQTGFDPETGEALYETEEMAPEPMPYLIVVVDEMADLMMVAGKEIEGAVQRLAQMARAAGIHLITATQRPSVDVITGTIKANFPTRISFQVTSKIDSRTILGEQGAEQLLGLGDMLHMAGGGRITRVHGPFVSDADLERVVCYLKNQGTPEYLDAVTEEPEEGGYDIMAGFGGEGDDLYQQAVEVVLRDRKASTSYIQRRLSIGYNRAATIIERMEEEGIVGPANHAGKREILLEGAD